MRNTYFQDATYEQQIRSITKDMEPRIRASFLSSMRDIKSRAQMGILRNALRDNDIEAAINALNLDAAAYTDMTSRVIEIYGKSGESTISQGRWIYPDGTRAVVRYNSLSPRAEAWARDQSTRLAVGLSNEAQGVARDVIADGYALGRNTDRIARDLVGRIGASGRRTGGAVGLDSQSAKWVGNLKQYLTTDPKRALSMKLNKRDKDALRRMIDAGKMPTNAQVDALLRRYENNLLMVRGRRIARTETINAIEAGKYEAWRQGLDKTEIPERFIIRTWVHTGRSAMDRIEHIMMNGDQRRGLQIPHVMPDGAEMMHPHDTSLGAGARHVINCQCREDYSIDKAGLRAWREGGG